MISSELIITCTGIYLLLLFYIAYHGDRQPSEQVSRYQPLIYTLSLTVYCTSWTFYGAVGNAAESGLSFFAIYLGPILVFVLFTPFLRKLINVSQRQKTTTIADFIATRYGKSHQVAAMVSLIALIGTLPYISLQIKAIASAYDTVTQGVPIHMSHVANLDSAFGLTIILALFAILFGARTIDAAEYRRGMMQAISLESIVKLIAFLFIASLAISIVIDLSTHKYAPDPITLVWSPFKDFDLDSSFITKTLLAASAIVLLPRQFHVMAVEARGNEINTARWGFPLYLLAFSIAVIPITTAGVQLSEGIIHADLFVLFLPMQTDSQWLTILSYLGGFSAATGMVIVAAITLSTMVSNDLIFPILMRYQRHRGNQDLHAKLLMIRRLTIFGLMLLAYGYYMLAGSGKSLYSIGLLSFAAAIQFMPAVVGGLYWKSGHRNGVLVGLGAGFLLWVYTLLIPSFIGAELNTHNWLNPQALFGVDFGDTLTHGVFWSLSANIVLYVIFSLRAQHSFTDRLQASIYVDMHESDNTEAEHSIRIIDLYELCSRFTGEQRARQFFHEHGHEAPQQSHQQVSATMLRNAQNLLAGSIGSATAEQLINSALKAYQPNAGNLYQLLGPTGEALQFNRQILQVTLDNIGQAVSVIDADLRLVAWNRLYVNLFNYPAEYLYVGKPIEEIIQFNILRGFGPAYTETLQDNVQKRLTYLRHGKPYKHVRDWQDGRAIQTQGARLPDGGFITTFTDITALKNAERSLAATNETLEAKVAERTQRLSELNAQLAEATQSKSRFLAAASHDLTQPLGASKLYMGALLEDLTGDSKAALAERALSAINTAESLLKALLDISKLDSGVMQPNISRFPIQQLFDALDNEFTVLAQEKGLNLRIHKSDCGTESDRDLLRSILQNFLSNAIRYTENGSILVICRRAGNQHIRIEVRDSGKGIAQDQLETIFAEFQQLDRNAEGVGLGLAIAQRMAALLRHSLQVRSDSGKGSTFSVTIPRLKAPNKTAPILEKLPAKTRWLEGLQILCVDDDQETLDATRALLERWGAHVDCLSHVDDFKQLIDQQSDYAILLMDYQLHEEENGLELLMAYRARHLKDFLGVLITAEQNPEIAQTALDRGFQFLAKPVEPAKLRSILHTAMLERQKSKQDAAP